MSASRIALLSVLLGTSAALATPARGIAQEGSQGPTVNVVVQNHSSSHVRVYVLQDAHMVPLGLVDGMGSSTLPVPPEFMQSDQPIQLIADPIEGSGWYKSGTLAVTPMDELDLTVESDVARSTVVLKH
jgi:hypothetical protein